MAALTALEPARPPVEQFDAYLRAGEVRFQECGSCGTIRTTSRTVCHRCLSREVTWRVVEGGGRVVSYVIAHEQIGTRLDVPYVVVHAEHDDGARFTANLLDVEPADVRVGMRVRLTIAKRDGVPLPQYVAEQADAAS